MLESKKIKDGVYWIGANDWDRRIFDALIPLPDGTSYNAYLVQGNEKTAVIDSVDPVLSDVLMNHIKDVEKVDYIISNHAEQDHSGTIPALLSKYPNSKVLTHPKGKALLMSHLSIAEERIEEVADGETLDLGGRTLEFIFMPWVHWPETMVTYLREDRILFSCDLFGSHLATSKLYSSKEQKVTEAIKRYYAEVMMPFRSLIKKHLAKLDEYEIDIIAPSHGPVHNETKFVIESHKEWVGEENKNIVVMPFISMHGSTLRMVDYLTDALSEEGVEVVRYDLTVTDAGRYAVSLVDAATIVVATPSFLTGAHPLVVSAAFLANALRPKLKHGVVIGSYGWGTRMSEQITDLMKGLRLEIFDPVLIKGAPVRENFEALDALASTIKAKHVELGIA